MGTPQLQGGWAHDQNNDSSEVVFLFPRPLTGQGRPSCDQRDVRWKGVR